MRDMPWGGGHVKRVSFSFDFSLPQPDTNPPRHRPEHQHTDARDHEDRQHRVEVAGQDQPSPAAACPAATFARPSAIIAGNCSRTRMVAAVSVVLITNSIGEQGHRGVSAAAAVDQPRRHQRQREHRQQLVGDAEHRPDRVDRAGADRASPSRA